MSVYRNGILYFHLFRETGKQEFRHGSVLWNKGREVCLSGLVYLCGYIVYSQAVICPLLMASLSTSSVKMEICPWFRG